MKVQSKIPSEVRLYRQELASDLLKLSSLLEKCYLNTGQIRRAASQLKSESVFKISPADEIDYTMIGYNINGIVINFDDVPNHTHPEEIENLTLNFDIKLYSNYTKDYNHDDPLRHLEFNIVVTGFVNDEEYITSYHLDRHPEGENETSESHPKYHFQFGGRKLDKRNREFGQSIILDSPRVMHYPMDLILGIDFIVSNFFPEKWAQLKKENDYVSLVKEYKDRMLRPFFASITNHWTGLLNGNSNWSDIEICPQLYK
ncbi:hypothetical protein KZY98_10010 [Croceibacter atlanticus]|uniref:hypothetical protein n=1 Tax=Croceibacter atlanticus TaxID=313588 RepID=UPI001C5E878C|nr:hypothetical protein [Croceibacter atlanticus]MBW4970792.1 hypothetical protein [Croceibacter atlanticus]